MENLDGVLCGGNDTQHATTDSADQVSASRFRALMAGHPSGVAIVTTLNAGRDPLGMTCSSLCGVSLNPPLLLVCIANESRTLAALATSEVFAVNLLHQHGQPAAVRFSGGARDRFGPVAWAPGPLTGMPCLVDDAHSVAECRLFSKVPAGDHTVVIGTVLSATSLAEHQPLLYGRRRYAVWPEAAVPTGKGRL